ncbi:MAG TPA: tetratricopeptide repeat protein [Thermoanaerobaculia bacterium]|nr:tetratricopeptide repeat protein [Thermoanaerobaculia bacterium]
MTALPVIAKMTEVILRMTATVNMTEVILNMTEVILNMTWRAMTALPVITKMTEVIPRMTAVTVNVTEVIERSYVTRTTAAAARLALLASSEAMPNSAEPRPEMENRHLLLDERRSAHASIRGYLYQTCLGVLRWLDLKPDEVLLCEGDEDLDRFLLGGGAVSEQVKAYTGGLSITDRVVRDSLRNFLRSYVTLRQRGESRKFVFTTTAYEKKRRDGLDFSLLEAWKEGKRTLKVVKRVRSLIQPSKEDPNRKAIEEARIWLYKDAEGWKGFMDAVEWNFDAPDLDALRGEIERKLQAERSALSSVVLLDRLIVAVLEASSQKEVEKRILTKADIDAQVGAFLADLGRSASSEAVRIRSVFEEVDNLRDLLDEGTRELPENPTPGQILTAAFEVIPFDEAGRREELDFLASCCGNAERRSVLLLTGEGGSGKTRLMLEWCRRLRHQGWHAGFLKRNRENDQILPLVKGTAPRLVVIDYAETRLGIVEQLLIEMGQAPQSEGPKLRVVLLARREGDWWTNLSLLSGDVAELLARSHPRQIRPLIPQNLAERQRAFRTAVEGFAENLQHEIPKDLHIPDLTDIQFDRALYLHMAALSALQGERIESAEDALDHTLEHERRFWRGQVRGILVNRHEQNLLYEQTEIAVAVVTLVGGTADFGETYDLLGRALPKLRSLIWGVQGAIADQLSILYQGSDPEKGRFIEPLQPDLLGEEWVARVLAHDESLIGRILDGGSPKEAYSTLTVLTRIARRRPDIQHLVGIALHGRLEQLGELALNVAVETRDPIGVELAKELQASGSPELVARLQEQCDSERYRASVPLREVAQVTTERALSSLRALEAPTEAQQVELSRLALHLGNRLSDLGRREDALVATREAVEIYRQLAQLRPDAFRPDLATSLNNLGNRLSDLGRREDALVATREAVEIYRQLAQLRPDAFRPDLAMSLNNLGARLSALGRREDALVATREAVEIRRQLAQLRPDAFRPDLAGSLGNLSRIFGELGQTEEAFQAIDEAVRIYAPLFLRLPAAFAPWMSMMVRAYLARAEASGKELDEMLLTPIVEALRSLPGKSDALSD